MQTQKELNLVEDLNLELPQSAVDPTKKVFKHFKQSRQNSGAPLVNQTWHTNGWPQKKLPKFGPCSHRTAIWLIEQSSILFAKFDCPVARQNFHF